MCATDIAFIFDRKEKEKKKQENGLSKESRFQSVRSREKCDKSILAKSGGIFPQYLN